MDTVDGAPRPCALWDLERALVTMNRLLAFDARWSVLFATVQSDELGILGPLLHGHPSERLRRCRLGALFRYRFAAEAQDLDRAQPPVAALADGPAVLLTVLVLTLVFIDFVKAPLAEARHVQLAVGRSDPHPIANRVNLQLLVLLFRHLRLGLQCGGRG